MRDAPIIFGAPSIRALLDGRKTQTRRILGPGNTWFDGRGWAKRHKAQTWNWGGAWVDAGPSPAGNTGPYLKLPWLSGPDPDAFEGTVHRIYPCHQPGMRLWVRESHHRTDDSADDHLVGYDLADDPNHWKDYARHVDGVGRVHFFRHSLGGWGGRSSRNYSSIHMPRWTSRLTLLVTQVRVQRLHDITDADAIAEGLIVAPNAGFDLYTGRPVPGYFVELPDGRRVGGTVESPRRIFALLWRALHPDEIPLLDEAGRKIGVRPNPARWDADPWIVATTFTVHPVHPVNVDQMPEASHAAS